MIFADTDFILALIKDSDWLKSKATTILNKHKGEIYTTLSVTIEIALVCKKLNLNAIEIFAHLFEIISVNPETYETSMTAALFMKKYGANVFDAFHAASAGNNPIISSDDIYDKIGLNRIKL